MLDKVNRLTESHGSLRPGHGLVSGALVLDGATALFNIRFTWNSKG